MKTLSQKIIHGKVNSFKAVRQMHNSVSQTEMTNKLLDGMVRNFFLPTAQVLLNTSVQQYLNGRSIWT